MTTDPNTGLPALPEGYFWRIKKWKHGVFDLHIHLMKKVGPFAFSAGDRLADTRPLSIHRAAYGIMMGVFNTKEHRALTNAKITKYVGDYPPKRLE